MEPQDGSIVGPNERAGEQEQFVTKRAEGETLPIAGKAYPLKRGHQVIGKPDDFEIQTVGCESPRGDVGESEVVAQFADADFDPRSAIVEMPKAGWGQVEVGNPTSIIVASKLKERQVAFCGFDQASGNHMASGFYPNGGMVFALGHLPVGVDPAVVQSREKVSQGLPHLRHNSVASIVIFQFG